MTAPIVETAKVMSKGQITLPKDIREKLHISEGERVVLMWDGDRVVMMNPAKYAMQMLSRGFEGAAEELDIEDDDDVMAVIKDVRAEGR